MICTCTAPLSSSDGYGELTCTYCLWHKSRKKMPSHRQSSRKHGYEARGADRSHVRISTVAFIAKKAAVKRVTPCQCPRGALRFEYVCWGRAVHSA